MMSSSFSFKAAKSVQLPQSRPLFFFMMLLTTLTSFFHNPVYQARSDPDPEGHLSSWSGEGEERTRERTDKGGAQTKTRVWKHQRCLSQVP